MPTQKDFKRILYPVIFVLKENKGIMTRENLFDYSLWMMRVGAPETLYSPERIKNSEMIFVDEFDVINANLGSPPIQ